MHLCIEHLHLCGQHAMAWRHTCNESQWYSAAAAWHVFVNKLMMSTQFAFAVFGTHQGTQLAMNHIGHELNFQRH